MQALALFDIDGTLVRRAGPAHKQALVVAIRRVARLETTVDSIPVHGMLDPDIVTLMMRAAGAPRRLIRDAMPEIVREAERVYLRTCPDLTRKTCPGVRAMLRRLAADGAVLGLVTGNLTRIGWRKLTRAGLGEYFRFGAFGEMAPTRAGLAKLAIRQARAEGWIGRGAAIALIGDAPADVLAAKANGIKSIAVCTGLSGREELAALGPDLLLDDLRGLRVGMVG